MKNKSQGTSKAGDMDWERWDDDTLERVRSYIEREIGYNGLFASGYKMGLFGKNKCELPICEEWLMIALLHASGKDTAIQQAIAQERESWMNQPANDHDARIRADERDRIRAGIKVLHEQNNEARPADEIEEADEQAYNAALFDVLKLITNNHE